VKKDLIETMAGSPLGDSQTHHLLVVSLQVLAQIENAFKDVINTGTMAKIQVREPTFLEKVKKFGRR
jgi:hypothetical protein